MAIGSLSSRLRFRRYRSDLRKRREEAAASKNKSAGPHTYGAAPAPSPWAGSDVKPARRHRSAWLLLKEFWRLLRGFHWRIAFALGTVTISTVLSLIPPYATKFVVDFILGDHPLPDRLARLFPPGITKVGLLWTIGLGIMAFSAVSVFIGMAGRWQATKTAAQVKPMLRRRVFEHAMKLPLHRVYQLKTGGTASLLREDTGAVGDLIFSMFYNPWRAIVQLIGSLIVLAWVDWRLLLGSLLFMPLVFITHQTWIRRIRPLYRDMHNTRQAIDGLTTEAFGGIRVVRSFARQRSESSRFIKADQFRARQEVHVWWWSRAIDIAWGLFIPPPPPRCFSMAGLQVLDGRLTIGDPVSVPDLPRHAARARGDARTKRDGASDIAGRARPHTRHVGRADGDALALRRGDARSLHGRRPRHAARCPLHVSRHRRAGARGHLHRHSAWRDGRAGWSERARGQDDTVQSRGPVLRPDCRTDPARWARPCATSSRTVTAACWASSSRTSSCSTARSLTTSGMAGRDATREQIMHYAKLAHADEFIRAFADGYETIIGERGVKLSGGQRQRLAIARALLADPRILILDEATSNLDTENERLIQESLRTLMAGRTSFVIAHRLSTIAHADRIVVLEKGRIVETGTHQELMERSGRYRQMVTIQTEPTLAARNRPAGPPSAAEASRAMSGSHA